MQSLPPLPTPLAKGITLSPIWVYGMPVLTEQGFPLNVSDMTPSNLTSMWNLAQLLATSIRSGQGLAAPQVNNPWQMFIFFNSVATIPSGKTDFPLVTGNNAPLAPPGDAPPSAQPYQVVINPVITPNVDTSGPLNPGLFWDCPSESCMSFPNYATGAPGLPSGISPITTKRLKSFTIDYYTFIYGIDGTPTGLVPKSYTCDYQNPEANQDLNWVLQHETDHVNGILFTERTPSTQCPVNADYLQQIEAGKVASDDPIVVLPGNQIPPA